MTQRHFLSVAVALGLFSSGLISCGSNGPGTSDVTPTEESGSDSMTPPAGGSTGPIETGTTGGGGVTGDGGTSGTAATGTSTGGTATTGTTTGTGGGSGGSGSGGTLTLTGGASICLIHPEICGGIQVIPGGVGPSPVGGYTPIAVGGGGVGDIPAPDATFRTNPGVEAIKQFGQYGTVTTPVVVETLSDGGIFTAPNGFIMYDGKTKSFPKDTVVTVTREGLATATTPDGAVENLPADATVVFTGGAAVTRNGTSAFTLQPGHAVKFGAGNFQIFQGMQGGTLKAPAVEKTLER